MSLILLILILLINYTHNSLSSSDNITSNYINNCNKYKNNEKPIEITYNNKYQLWPHLSNQLQLDNGQVLYGFYDAIDIIYKNQHPQDCSKAKYLISNGYPSGFGSQIHVEGSGLTIALNTNRVYLMHPGGPGKLKPFLKWQTNNRFCKDQHIHTLECYYQSWSNCTLLDALDGNIQSYTAINEYNKLKYNDNIKAIKLIHTDNEFNDIPNVFNDLLSCSSLNQMYKKYWWRAITATYLLRPNNNTLTKLNQLKTFHLNNNSLKKCIAMYVRHGDKHVEMKLLPLANYIKVAEEMWSKHMVQNNNTNQLSYSVFVGTEDPIVIRDAIEWSNKNNIQSLYTNLFDRSAVSAHQNSLKQKNDRLNQYRSHELEYLNILLNLEYSLMCDAWVCTLASNFCRLIDELRSTIGGKANFHFADISTESCHNPPCYDGQGVYNLDW